MGYCVGLDVSLKRTAICVPDDDGGSAWRGWADTHPEMIAAALDRWRPGIEKVGLETGSTTPWLARGLSNLDLPVVVMDARRAAAAMKTRPTKTDRTDARAHAEMLRSGWFGPVFVKSENSHRIKALLSAREQLVKNKRTLLGQIQGILRPFAIKLPGRQGTNSFDEAARAASRHDDVLYACVSALLEALAAIDGCLVDQAPDPIGDAVRGRGAVDTPRCGSAHGECLPRPPLRPGQAGSAGGAVVWRGE